jgi:CubicO group peptidase (beta-lactamase class C family)
VDFMTESWLNDLRAEHDVPGAQVATLAPDGTIQAIATGTTSRTTNVEVTTDTLFQYGSISKIWTTTLVMQLVDDALLTLDTPITEVLPQFRVKDPAQAEAITVEHLLTHTSGIVGDLFTDTGDGDECVERYVATLTDAPSVTRPGGRLSYCNAGFVLAGRLAEVLRGQCWDDVVADRIADPLALRHTITRAKDAPLHRAAVGHIAGTPRAVPTKTWMLPRALGPAGLITGSATDLLTFAAAHLNDGGAATGRRILSADSAQAMRRPRVDISDVSTTVHSWGLGWILSDWGGVAAVSHAGQTIGQHARLHTFPERGTAFCVLTNSVGGPALAQAVEDAYAEAEGLTPPRPTSRPGADLDAALGVYETPIARCTLSRAPHGGYQFTVENSLHESPDEPPLPVRPTGDGRFTVELNGVASEFCHVVEDGAEFLYYHRLFPKVG